jgi:hypothetical protein
MLAAAGAAGDQAHGQQAEEQAGHADPEQGVR